MLALALPFAAAAACGGDAPPPRPPDVLLVSLDSVRADALTFLDEALSPNLCALARRGTLFTSAVSGTSWTLPAHAQLFLGLPPAVHGVHLDHIRMDPSLPTLPERLARAGYRTAGVYTSHYLDAQFGFARGFDTFVSAMGEVPAHSDVSTDRLVDRALEAVEGAPADQPLFLFAHVMDPHYDYVPPPPFDTRFDPDYTGDLDARGFLDNPRIFDPGKRPRRQVSDRDLQHLVALYHGEVAWTDHALGRLLEGLERSGRLARTLVVVTADHGDEFFEHDGTGHRDTLYDEVLRVPLLIVPPGAAASGAPARCDVQVSLSDLAPTILDYAGQPPDARLSGRSLRPLLEGGALPPRPELSSLALAGPPADGGHEYRLYEALRTEDWKLIRQVGLTPRGPPRLEGLSWFDLRADPTEQRPVTDRRDPRLQAAWDALEAEVAALRALSGGMPASGAAQRGTDLDEAAREDLAALGYTGLIDPGEPVDEVLLRPLPPLDLR